MKTETLLVKRLEVWQREVTWKEVQELESRVLKATDTGCAEV